MGFVVKGPRTFEWYGDACCKSDSLVRAIDEYLKSYGLKNRKIPSAIMRTIESQLAKKRKGEW